MMKSVVLEEPGRFVQSDKPEPAQPGPGEALVRVSRIGVCGTDLHAFRGRQPFFEYPRVLGHELGVEVLAVGEEVENIRVGDRCAVEPYLHCGECIACRQGKTNCCVRLKVLGVHVDGGMTERLVLPASNLHRSESLSLDQLALVETLGIGAHAVDRAALVPGETALVIGAGPIGLSVMQFAKAAGARVIALDVNADRLRFAAEAIGPDETVVAGIDSLQEVERLTGGDLATAVFDATGNPESMMQSFQFVSHGGRLVFVGLFQGDVTFNDPTFHRREMTLLSSRNSTAADFQRIIHLVESGDVDTTPWITHRAPLERVVADFPAWLDPAQRVVKAIVEVGS
jgi:2-desacetyl-2-hydroxyethyl bacteriochlorophyllide A dehydrogenase